MRASLLMNLRTGCRGAAPETVDFSKETPETKKLYGIGETATDDFGHKCLLARRLVERGVRFVQIYSGNECRN